MGVSTRSSASHLPEGLISCGLCSRPFTDPRVLPCQHTFCLQCLQAVSSDQNTDHFTMFGDFRCPICQNRTRLPQEGAAGLPPDFRVGQFRDLLRTVDLLPSSPETDCVKHRCDICRSQNKNQIASDVFCLQCGRFMCCECKDLHNSNSLFTDHSLLPLAQQDSSELKCLEHEETVQFACKPCGSILCLACVFTSHRGHPICLLASATPDQVTAIRDLSTDLFQSRRQFIAQSEQLHALQETLNAVCTEARSAINDHADAMMQRVCSNRDRLIGELDSFQQSSIARLKAKQREVELHVTEISQACAEADEVTDSGGTLKLMAQFDSLMSRLTKLKEQLVFEPVGEDLKLAPQFLPRGDTSVGELDTYTLTCDPVMVDSVDSACFGSEASSFGVLQPEDNDPGDKTPQTTSFTPASLCGLPTKWPSSSTLSGPESRSFPLTCSWHRTPNHSYVSLR